LFKSKSFSLPIHRDDYLPNLMGIYKPIAILQLQVFYFYFFYFSYCYFDIYSLLKISIMLYSSTFLNAPSNSLDSCYMYPTRYLVISINLIRWFYNKDWKPLLCSFPTHIIFHLIFTEHKDITVVSLIIQKRKFSVWMVVMLL
jgi:hypothetical protein